MLDWTEKYRPKNLTNIIGNRKTIMSLKKWADEWIINTPKKKSVILSGKPGIGKTSCAYALANEYNWTPIELNTSDARNSSKIKAVATIGATHQTFKDDGSYISTNKGGRKLIILDEADNLYERIEKDTKNKLDLSDKGGKKTIIQTIKQTNQPIILIVNDYYQLVKGSGEALKNLALHFTFYPPYSNEIVPMLQYICRNENVNVDLQVLQIISEGCDGDIRSTIRDLQSLCMGKTNITYQDLKSIGHRDRKSLIFDLLNDIFKTKNIEVIRKRMRNLDEDPQMILQWINENLPKSYNDLNDLEKAYDSLSKSAMYLDRTRIRQQYGLWSYACDHMSLGVSLAKLKPPTYLKYSFPNWLKHVKQAKTAYEHQNLIINKISKMNHCSLRKCRQEIYLNFLRIFQNNKKFALKMINQIDLSEEEILFLYGKNKKTAKEIIELLQEKKDHPEQIIIDESENITQEKTIKKDERSNQQKLFIGI